MKYLEKFQPGGPIGWTVGVPIEEQASPSLQRARLYGVTQKPEVAEEQVSEEGQKNRDYARRKAAYMEEVARVQDGTRPFVGQLSPGQDFIYTGMPITSTFSIADDMSKSAQLIGPAIKNGQWGAAVGNALKIPSGLVLGAASLVPGVGLAKNIVQDAVKGTHFVATHNPLYYYNASKPLAKGVRYMPNEKGGYTLLNTKGNHLAFPEKGAQVQPSEFGDWFMIDGKYPATVVTPWNKLLVKGSKITAKDYASNINKQQLRANQEAANLRYTYRDFPTDSPVFSAIDDYVRNGLLDGRPMGARPKFLFSNRRSAKPVEKTVKLIKNEDGVITGVRLLDNGKWHNTIHINVPQLLEGEFNRALISDQLEHNLVPKKGISLEKFSYIARPDLGKEYVQNINKNLQYLRRLHVENPQLYSAENLNYAISKQPSIIVETDLRTNGRSLDALNSNIAGNYNRTLSKRAWWARADGVQRILNELLDGSKLVPNGTYVEQILAESPQYRESVEAMLKANPNLTQEEIVKNLLAQRFTVTRGMNSHYIPNATPEQLSEQLIRIPDTEFGGRSSHNLFTYDPAKQDILYTSNSLPTAYSYSYPETNDLHGISIIERDPATFDLTGTPLDWWHHNRLYKKNKVVFLPNGRNAMPGPVNKIMQGLSAESDWLKTVNIKDYIKSHPEFVTPIGADNGFGHILFLGDRGTIPANMRVKDQIIFKNDNEFRDWIKAHGYDYGGTETRAHTGSPSLGFTLGDKHGGTLKQINYLDLFKQKQK